MTAVNKTLLFIYVSTVRESHKVIYVEQSTSNPTVRYYCQFLFKNKKKSFVLELYRITWNI